MYENYFLQGEAKLGVKYGDEKGGSSFLFYAKLNIFILQPLTNKLFNFFPMNLKNV